MKLCPKCGAALAEGVTRCCKSGCDFVLKAPNQLDEPYSPELEGDPGLSSATSSCASTDSTTDSSGESMFPWDDVDAARNDAALQSNHNSETVRREFAERVRCPKCSCSGDRLAWFYFCSPAWTWEHLCGRAGWMAVCDSCHQQVEFVCDVMN